MRIFTISALCLLFAVFSVPPLYAADANNRPNASNTGPTGTLQTQSGNKSLGSNQTLENVNLNGCVTINGANVTIRNSKINCTSGASSINIGSGSSKVLLEKIEVVRPNGSGASVYMGAANDVTIRAADMSNGADVIMIQNVNGLLVEDSFLHDPKLVGSAHVDVLQVTGGKNITIRNNTLITGVGASGGGGSYVSCILNKADLGVIDNVVIDNNYFSGGQYTVYTMAGNNNACNNVTGGKFAAPTNVKITNNTFSGTRALGDLVANPATGLVINCNRHPDGSLIQYRKYDTSKCEATYYNSTCSGGSSPTHTPVPVPTSTPEPEPTDTPVPGITCAKKEQGDADCNDAIAITDYALWRSEFIGGCSPANLTAAACGDDRDGDGSIIDTDFNADSNVSLIDFQIWKTAFVAGS